MDGKIINGASTNIWYDPWLNGYSLINKLGWNALSVAGSGNRWVSTLISNNNWKNNLECVPTQMQTTVYNIKFHNQMHHDYRFWLPNSNCQFSLSSSRNHIRVKYEEFNWIGVIWDHYCAPKMSTCTLLVKLNWLNIKDRTFIWNNNIDRSCVFFCLNHFEDREHLIFNCSYSRQILKVIMQTLNINIRIHLIFHKF